MQTKDIISRLGGKSLGQVIRFGIVGVAATAIQAVLYQVLVGWLRAELANAIAYVVSFIFNYVASTRFTFRVKSSARRGAGFLLSHLINCSPMVLWHGFVCQPTGVTILSTEEREKGIASWRISTFGDVSHLTMNGEKPSFAARFRETYGDGSDERKED